MLTSRVLRVEVGGLFEQVRLRMHSLGRFDHHSICGSGGCGGQVRERERDKERKRCLLESMLVMFKLEMFGLSRDDQMISVRTLLTFRYGHTET